MASEYRLLLRENRKIIARACKMFFFLNTERFSLAHYAIYKQKQFFFVIHSRAMS